MAEQPKPGPAAEQNMDEILASIRQTLSGMPSQLSPNAPAAAPPTDKEVLILQPSMLVPEDQPAQPSVPPPSASAAPPAMPPAATTDRASAAAASGPVPAVPSIPPKQLVAPEAAAAAATAVGELVRTLSVERSTTVFRGGPTIEDLVREEIRPLLKAWLDANLPQMVERAVQTEIERVIARSST